MGSIQVTADDFGLSLGVNEAVEQAYRNGSLTAASLMVAGPAAGDAVRRARALPGLRVGLHLVAVEGPAVLPPSRIPALVGHDGWFPSDQFRLGLRYAFHPAARRQLAEEVEAQFAAYAATGLPLHHADAHKHMHLHPRVGALLVRAGRKHGLRRVRVPAEPPSLLRACGTRPGASAHAMHAWTGVLRAQLRRAGLAAPEWVLGLAWSGHMTRERVGEALQHLPAASGEIYFHPATGRDALLTRLMPEYEHERELDALLDPALRAVVRERPAA